MPKKSKFCLIFFFKCGKINVYDYIIKSLRSAKRFDYRFRYDTKKKINEQNISKRAKLMISRLYRDYMVSERVRNIILSKEKFDKKKANSN